MVSIDLLPNDCRPTTIDGVMMREELQGLTDEQRAAYLHRIDYRGVPAPHVASLRALHRAHLLAVPFENLDIHLGRRIELEIGSIVSKVVDDRRGGFCYELNGSFAALLASLGFDVTMHEARAGDGVGPGTPFDHLALSVRIGSDRFLADVGFGAFNDEPLNLDDRTDQRDPAGIFRLGDRDDGWVDVFKNEHRQYRLLLEPRLLADFEPGCTYHQTSPASHFTQGTVCSLRTTDGRVTLSGLTLTETVHGTKHTRELRPGELQNLLTDRFGVVLGRQEVRKLSRIPAS